MSASEECGRRGRAASGRAWLCAGALLCVGARLPAQTVTGRVTEQESGAPLRAALVVLLDSAGHERGAELTSQEGAFVLRAPAPGRYSVRVEHIGRENVRSAPLLVGAGATATVQLEAAIAAVLLRPIEVLAHSRCSVRPDVGEPTAQLWEEARKALRASRVVMRSRPVVIRRFERRIDPATLTERSTKEDVVAGITARPFGSFSEDSLNRFGYVRQIDNEFEFSGPDETVLLSDGFLDHHCLELTSANREHAGMLGVAFKPMQKERPDISGVAWLDAATAELRLVEFHYTRLPWDVDDRSQGGHLEFVRLASGAIGVRSWYLRMPVVGLHVSLHGNATFVKEIVESGAEIMNAPAKGSPKP